MPRIHHDHQPHSTTAAGLRTPRPLPPPRPGVVSSAQDSPAAQAKSRSSTSRATRPAARWTVRCARRATPPAAPPAPGPAPSRPAPQLLPLENRPEHRLMFFLRQAAAVVVDDDRHRVRPGGAPPTRSASPAHASPRCAPGCRPRAAARRPTPDRPKIIRGLDHDLDPPPVRMFSRATRSSMSVTSMSSRSSACASCPDASCPSAVMIAFHAALCARKVAAPLRLSPRQAGRGSAGCRGRRASP